MNGFERRKKAKMESILNSAFELFCYRGIKEVSMAEIAKKAQVSQVSIYNFFGSKENLVRQSLYSYMNIKMKEYELLLNSDLSFMEKFQKIVFDKMEAAHYSEEFYQFVIWEDPVVQNFIHEYYLTHSLPFLLKFIEQGKAEGFVNHKITNESILVYVGMFKDALTKPNLSMKTRMDLGSLFFYGLLGKPSSQ